MYLRWEGERWSTTIFYIERTEEMKVNQSQCLMGKMKSNIFEKEEEKSEEWSESL